MTVLDRPLLRRVLESPSSVHVRLVARRMARTSMIVVEHDAIDVLSEFMELSTALALNEIGLTFLVMSLVCLVAVRLKDVR